MAALRYSITLYGQKSLISPTKETCNNSKSDLLAALRVASAADVQRAESNQGTLSVSAGEQKKVDNSDDG